MEYLQGKTFFEVYFGTGGGPDNLIENVPVVTELSFGSDGFVTSTGLLNGFNDLVSYEVDASGQIFFGGEDAEVTVLSCGSTDQYLKTEAYADGTLDSVDLYFFNVDDALAFANSLSAPIAPCVPDESGADDVTGTWRGQLVLDVEDEGLTGTVDISFILTQNGSAVSGTTIENEGQDRETGTLSGSIDGTTLNLTWFTDDTSEDCSVFNIQLTFELSNTELTLTAASGRSCDGGSDPGPAIKIVSGGSAVLFKQ